MDTISSDDNRRCVLLAFYLGRHKLLNCIAIYELTRKILDAFGNCGSEAENGEHEPDGGCCICKVKETIFKDIWMSFKMSQLKCAPEGLKKRDARNAWNDVVRLWSDLEKLSKVESQPKSILSRFEKASKGIMMKHGVSNLAINGRERSGTKDCGNWLTLIKTVKSGLISCLTRIRETASKVFPSTYAFDKHLQSEESCPENLESRVPTSDLMSTEFWIDVGKDADQVVNWVQKNKFHGVLATPLMGSSSITVEYTHCSKCVPLRCSRKNISLLQVLESCQKICEEALRTGTQMRRSEQRKSPAQLNEELHNGCHLQLTKKVDESKVKTDIIDCSENIGNTVRRSNRTGIPSKNLKEYVYYDKWGINNLHSEKKYVSSSCVRNVALNPQPVKRKLDTEAAKDKTNKRRRRSGKLGSRGFRRRKPKGRQFRDLGSESVQVNAVLAEEEMKTGKTCSLAEAASAIITKHFSSLSQSDSQLSEEPKCLIPKPYEPHFLCSATTLDQQGWRAYWYRRCRCSRIEQRIQPATTRKRKHHMLIPISSHCHQDENPYANSKGIAFELSRPETLSRVSESQNSESPDQIATKCIKIGVLKPTEEKFECPSAANIYRAQLASSRRQHRHKSNRSKKKKLARLAFESEHAPINAVQEEEENKSRDGWSLPEIVSTFLTHLSSSETKRQSQALEVKKCSVPKPYEPHFMCIFDTIEKRGWAAYWYWPCRYAKSKRDSTTANIRTRRHHMLPLRYHAESKTTTDLTALSTMPKRRKLQAVGNLLSTETNTESSKSAHYKSNSPCMHAVKRFPGMEDGREHKSTTDQRNSKHIIVSEQVDSRSQCVTAPTSFMKEESNIQRKLKDHTKKNIVPEKERAPRYNTRSCSVTLKGLVPVPGNNQSDNLILRSQSNRSQNSAKDLNQSTSVLSKSSLDSTLTDIKSGQSSSTKGFCWHNKVKEHLFSSIDHSFKLIQPLVMLSSCCPSFADIECTTIFPHSSCFLKYPRGSAAVTDRSLRISDNFKALTSGRCKKIASRHDLFPTVFSGQAHFFAPNDHVVPESDKKKALSLNKSRRALSFKPSCNQDLPSTKNHAVRFSNKPVAHNRPTKTEMIKPKENHNNTRRSTKRTTTRLFAGTFSKAVKSLKSPPSNAYSSSEFMQSVSRNMKATEAPEISIQNETACNNIQAQHKQNRTRKNESKCLYHRLKCVPENATEEKSESNDRYSMSEFVSRFITRQHSGVTECSSQRSVYKYSVPMPLEPHYLCITDTVENRGWRTYWYWPCRYAKPKRDSTVENFSTMKCSTLPPMYHRNEPNAAALSGTVKRREFPVNSSNVSIETITPPVNKRKRVGIGYNLSSSQSLKFILGTDRTLMSRKRGCCSDEDEDHHETFRSLFKSSLNIHRIRSMMLNLSSAQSFSLKLNSYTNVMPTNRFKLVHSVTSRKNKLSTSRIPETGKSLPEDGDYRCGRSPKGIKVTIKNNREARDKEVTSPNMPSISRAFVPLTRCNVPKSVVGISTAFCTNYQHGEWMPFLSQAKVVNGHCSIDGASKVERAFEPRSLFDEKHVARRQRRSTQRVTTGRCLHCERNCFG